ncbi:hypothetical protein [Mucilaginibacter paludis]|uniref:Uncharacterized protein n=1 Tax=Mucilaginibacter paludis DSM 18603 TaxID=714943 RepID=H1YFG4_9SPHI|nr:hypothetical protein [Mucilaginibacter paludis]EHQ27272.1 hypothetical protein Mucpa_3168 [Mucilaginibacter paludis DSM 18603]
MNNNQQPPSFKVIRIIHIALCTGSTLFLVVASSIKPGPVHTAIEPGDIPLLYVAVALAAMMAFVSGFLYHKKLAEINFSAPVSNRLTQYMSACIMRYAPLEGAALFNTAVWLLTGNLIAAMVAVAVILYLISARPVKSKIISDLKITYPDTLD